MARAKRTDRAEARRRYRAATTTEPPLADEEDFEPEPAPTARRPIRPSAAAASAPARPSVLGAVRTSMRPLDLRSDLRALPRLLLTRAFLVPVVLSGAAFAAFLIDQNAVTAFLYQFFSWQFPVAGVFIAGYFARRASYLLGALVAIASALFQFPFLATQPPGVIFGVLVQGALYGALFAAAAAWYRRFLSNANPNRAARQGGPGTRPDGRIAKRNQGRPMLARRR